MFDLPPMRFIAIASVSCASWLIEPYDIAPVANRLTIDSTGSTSSIGIGVGRVLQLEQAAQRRELLALVVDEPRVLLEDRVLPAPRRVLQLEHRLRVEQVVLAVAPPLVLAAPLEVVLADRPRRERLLVPPPHFFGDDVDADAADARRGAREVLVDERAVEADRLEHLRAAVALQRRDAHLGHHLEDALVERLDVVLDRLLVRDADEHPLPDHVVERLERQVRVDRAGAVAEEQRAVMHFARVARFDDQRAARARALRAPGDGARPPWPAGSESARASRSASRSDRIRIV